MHSDPFRLTEQLLQKLSVGNEKAFQMVFNHYYDKLYCYCLKFLKSEELAKETVQEVFLKLWMYKAHIDSQQNFDAYLYKIARNQILDTLHELSRDRQKKAQFMAAAQQEKNFRCQTEDELSFSDYASFAEQAVAQLPAQRKLIFQLSRQQGLSHEEIAASLGISKNTVKVQIFRALKTIKTYLKTYTDFTLLWMMYFLFP